MKSEQRNENKQEPHDSLLNIRVSNTLKVRFQCATDANGVMLSETLRAYMDEYATRHEELKKDQLSK
jgi:hypothetical protein